MTGDERPADQRPAEVDQRARREARWVAWLWIGLGFVTSTFAIGSEIWKPGSPGR